MDTTQQATDLVPQLKSRLEQHGFDIKKLDDREWTSLVNEVGQIYGYDGPQVSDAPAKGTFDR